MSLFCCFVLFVGILILDCGVITCFMSFIVHMLGLLGYCGVLLFGFFYDGSCVMFVVINLCLWLLLFTVLNCGFIVLGTVIRVFTWICCFDLFVLSSCVLLGLRVSGLTF